MQPQRIALVVHGFPTRRLAGTELYVARLARHLTARGLDLDIVYPVFDRQRAAGETHDFSWHGIPVFEVCLHLPPDLEARHRDERAAEILTDLLTVRRIRLAHFHHLIGFTGASLESCAKAGIRNVLTAHDGWLVCEQAHLLRFDGGTCPDGPQDDRQCASCLFRRRPELAGLLDENGAESLLARRRAYLRQVSAKAEMILAPSRFMAKLLTRQGFDSGRIKYSPLGVESPSRKPERKERTGRLRLGFFGNLAPVKGIDLILEAMGMLDPELVTLDIHGGSLVPGWERAVIEAVSGRRNIRMHGRYEPADLPGLLAAVDLAVIPSRMESYSFVARECLQMGVPVIATCAGALPEIVRDGETGWLIPPDDPSALVDIVRRVLMFPDELERMSMKNLSLETSPVEAKRLHGYYSEILGRVGSTGHGQEP